MTLLLRYDAGDAAATTCAPMPPITLERRLTARYTITMRHSRRHLLDTPPQHIFGATISRVLYFSQRLPSLQGTSWQLPGYMIARQGRASINAPCQ